MLAGGGRHIDVVIKPSSEATTAIASVQTSAPSQPENQIPIRKRKISEKVDQLDSEELEIHNDDAIVDLALRERDEDLAKLRERFSVIVDSSEDARYRAQAVCNEVNHYSWLNISDFVNLQQLGTQQTALMSNVAHASLTKAEKREFLKDILDDAQLTSERLRVAIDFQQELIDEFLEDHKVLKNYLITVDNIKAEADLISMELTK